MVLQIGRFVAQILRGECLLFAKLVRFGEFFGGSFPWSGLVGIAMIENELIVGDIAAAVPLRLPVCGNTSCILLKVGKQTTRRQGSGTAAAIC